MNKPINNLCVLVLLFIITACQSPEARAPISRSSGSYIKEMAQRNKALTQKEQKLIMQYIEADSLHDYQDSKNGFWYTYDIKSELDTVTPKFGDRVFYTYNVRSFSGDTIYSAEALQPQNYLMDKETLFSGLRQGLKLMKTGEKVTFLFLSQKAYGFYGDKNKIGSNIPLICNVTLDSIQQQ